ncbi:hypothetical protein EV424DRAFT_512605 [Suillus variegatus]|nr:hypothetical protein EV424DRAFT_512605 [Suillus variegatus]
MILRHVLLARRRLQARKLLMLPGGGLPQAFSQIDSTGSMAYHKINSADLRPKNKTWHAPIDNEEFRTLATPYPPVSRWPLPNYSLWFVVPAAQTLGFHFWRISLAYAREINVHEFS